MFSNVERLPGAPELHRWADWAELLAYTSSVGSISMTEFAETLERNSDLLDVESQDEPADVAAPEIEPLIEASLGEPSEFRDALAARSGDILAYLLDRSTRYGPTYPFEISRVDQAVTLRDSSWSRRLYLHLLACSTLRYISAGADRTRLTSEFELLGLEVVSRLLPGGSEVHLFGANSLASGRYKGLLINKIKALSEDLGERFLAEPEDFNSGDTGDNGLDVVGWVSMGDSLPGRIMVFAQAACTQDWVSKQHSSQTTAWSSVMTMTSDPMNVVLIPYDYRRPGNNWYTKRHIHKSTVIDRFRMMQLLATGKDLDDPLVNGEQAMSFIDVESLDRARGQGAADL